MPTVVTVTIKQSGGDYSSLTDFEANYPNKNLVSQDIQLTAMFYGANWTLADNSAFNSGWTTDATHYIKLSVNPADRHTGKVGTGFALTTSGNSIIRPVTAAGVVHLDGIRFVRTGSAVLISSENSGGNAGCGTYIENCFIDGADITGVRVITGQSGNLGARFTIKNSFVVRGGDADGVYIYQEIVNVTAWGFSGTARALVGDGFGAGAIKNCVVGGLSGGATAILANSATVSYCAISDTSASGTGVIQNATATDNGSPGAGTWVVFRDITTAGAQDLRLKDCAANAAINAGVSDQNYDFKGYARRTPPDLGADEVVETSQRYVQSYDPQSAVDTIQYVSNVTKGNLLVLAVRGFTDYIVSVSDNYNHVWKQASAGYDPGNTFSLDVWYTYANQSGVKPTITPLGFYQNAAALRMVCAEYSGVSGVPYEVTSRNTAGGQSTTPASGNVTINRETLALGIVGAAGDYSGFTPGPAWTAREIQSGRIAFCDDINAPVGNRVHSGTLAATQAWFDAILLFGVAPAAPVRIVGAPVPSLSTGKAAFSQGNGVDTTGTTGDISLSSPVSAGTLIVVTARLSSGVQPVGVTDSLGTKYKAVCDRALMDSGDSTVMYWGVTTAAGASNTVRVTTDTSNTLRASAATYVGLPRNVVPVAFTRLVAALDYLSYAYGTTLNAKHLMAVEGLGSSNTFGSIGFGMFVDPGWVGRANGGVKSYIGDNLNGDFGKRPNVYSAELTGIGGIIALFGVPAPRFTFTPLTAPAGKWLRAPVPAAFDIGFNFRASAGYVTDQHPSVFSTAGSSGSMYPQYRKEGVRWGWTWSAYGGTGGPANDSRDRSNSVDARFAGIVFPGAATSQFVVELPCPGVYDIRAALGDYSNGQAIGVKFYDGRHTTSAAGVEGGATLVGSVYGSTGGVQRFIDASGVIRTSPDDWIANNKPLRAQFNTRTFVMWMDNAPASNTIAHLRITLVRPLAEMRWMPTLPAQQIELVQSVQSGSLDITASDGLTVDMTISAVDVSRSIVMFSQRHTATDDRFRNSYWMQLTSPTNVTFTRYATLSGEESILEWTVIQFAPGVLQSLQRGTIDRGTSAINDIAINAVDVSRTFVLQTVRGASTATDVWRNLPRATLQSPTLLRLESALAPSVAGDSNVAYQVVEFTPASGVTVQSGVIDLADTDETTKQAVIRAVDPTKSFVLHGGYKATQPASGAYRQNATVRLVDATHIEARRSPAGTTTADGISYFVVSGPFASVQQFNVTIPNGESFANKATQTIALSDSTKVGYDDGSWHGSEGYVSSNQTSVGSVTTNAVSFALSTTIPAGSTVVSAYFRPYFTATGSGAIAMRVRAEKVEPTGNTAWGTTHRPVGATYTTAVAEAAVSTSGLTFPAYNYGPADQQTLDIKALIQELVDTYGALSAGEFINLGYNNYLNANYWNLAAPATNNWQLIINWIPPMWAAQSLTKTAVMIGHTWGTASDDEDASTVLPNDFLTSFKLNAGADGVTVARWGTGAFEIYPAGVSVDWSIPGAPAAGFAVVSVTPSMLHEGLVDVVLAGSGFGASQGTSKLLLDGVEQTVTAWSDTSITFTVVKPSPWASPRRLAVRLMN